MAIRPHTKLGQPLTIKIRPDQEEQLRKEAMQDEGNLSRTLRRILDKHYSKARKPN